MSRIQKADWSTINLDELRKLPVFDYVKHGYHLQDDSGNGCAGDPPGYPSYFTQAVYNSQGNNPASGFNYVIVHDGKAYGIDPIKWQAGETWEKRQESQKELFRRLWKPLPIDHPRTQAWIIATFAHHKNCYQVPELRAQGKNWSDAMLIWPGGCLGKTPFGKLKNLEFEVEHARKHSAFDKWTPIEQGKFIADVEANNKRVTRFCEIVAVPANHDGTIIVQRYYPDFFPTKALLDDGLESEGNWWETLATKPTPQTCPGQYGNAHPVNGKWCQFCGWHEEEAAAA